MIRDYEDHMQGGFLTVEFAVTRVNVEGYHDKQKVVPISQRALMILMRNHALTLGTCWWMRVIYECKNERLSDSDAADDIQRRIAARRDAGAERPGAKRQRSETGGTAGPSMPAAEAPGGASGASAPLTSLHCPLVPRGLSVAGSQ